MDVIGGLKEGLTMDEEKWLSKESPFFFIGLVAFPITSGPPAILSGKLGEIIV